MQILTVTGILDIAWGFTEKSDFKGEAFTKNQYIWENCLKKGGAWIVCKFKRGLGAKEGGVIPKCTL